MKSEESIYLPTGNQILDNLLSPDSLKEGGAGFLIRPSNDALNKSGFSEPPIILIEGEAGTGKTTLSLQIAHAAAKLHTPHSDYMKYPNLNCIDWSIYYYSLEQSSLSLRHLSRNFGFSPEPAIEGQFYHDEASIEEHKNDPGRYDNAKFLFCKFSNRPISAPENKDVFEQRMSELGHALQKAKDTSDKNKRSVFFVDCLNALSGRALVRNDIYRLFQLFRANKIPAILTLEKAAGLVGGEYDITALAAEFLSDIVIRLARISDNEYNFNHLEIIKSRVCKQVPGKHIYKIRISPKDIPTNPVLGEEKASGIVVFPSIYYLLSKAKERTNAANVEEDYFVGGTNPNEDIRLILNGETIKHNSTIAINGPNGTHKLALGLNFAMGFRKCHEKEYSHALVLNFGGSDDFNFKGIAWTQSNQDFHQIDGPFPEKGVNYWRQKYWASEYYLSKNENRRVTLLSFKIGQLTPEECFYIIESILTQNEAFDGAGRLLPLSKMLVEREKSVDSSGDITGKRQNPFTSVIISNTAEVSTGFPLLRKDLLFLPSLIDLFNTHELVTVCIGVENQNNALIQDANFTLSARADYRINLYHYPEMEQLSDSIIYKNQEQLRKLKRLKQNIIVRLKEQLISLVIDNVSGRHYSRQPRWLYVEENEVSNEKVKTLRCRKDVQDAIEAMNK